MCDIACAGSAFCNRPMNRHICIVITIDYVVFHFFFYFFPLINDARIKNTVFFLHYASKPEILRLLVLVECTVCECVDCSQVGMAKTNIVIGASYIIWVYALKIGFVQFFVLQRSMKCDEQNQPFIMEYSIFIDVPMRVVKLSVGWVDVEIVLYAFCVCVWFNQLIKKLWLKLNQHGFSAVLIKGE